jgi:hypothetical protein
MFLLLCSPEKSCNTRRLTTSILSLCKQTYHLFLRFYHKHEKAESCYFSSFQSPFFRQFSFHYASPFRYSFSSSPPTDSMFSPSFMFTSFYITIQPQHNIFHIYRTGIYELSILVWDHYTPYRNINCSIKKKSFNRERWGH